MAIPPRKRRRILTRARILDAAERIYKRKGIDQLSLRGVATSLAVTPMALYRHVDGIEDITNELVERAASKFRPTRPPVGDWRVVLEWCGEGLLDLFTAHPIAVEAFLRQPVSTPRTRALAEPALTAMVDAGYTVEDAAIAYRSVLALAVGYASLHLKWHRTGPPSRTKLKELSRAIETSAADEGLPTMAKATDIFVTPYPREHYQTGLRAIVAGIADPARRESRD